MIIYHYSRETGRYIHASVVEIDHFGKPLIPAWSTTEQPPEPRENQIVKWQNGTWVLEDILQPEIEQQPELTPEQKLTAIRAERDRLLDGTTWIFQRQLTGTDNQKLPAEEYQAWVDYWAALRDFPNTCDPDNPMWPKQPIER